MRVNECVECKEFPCVDVRHESYIIPALARDVAYGKRGRMTERDFHGMMRTCSCLILILDCIVYWQAKEIDGAVAEGNPEEEEIDTSLLGHVSPIEWDNVLLYGEYVIDPRLIR